MDIDRTKAKSLGVAISDIASTLQIYLGSLYVNDFNKYGRVYRVFMQADERARAKAEDIGRLYVRNAQGQMIPLSTLTTVSPKVGPQTVEHYNLFRTAQITASPAPGRSSGQAIEAMEELAREVLPAEMGYEWTGIAFQELQAGNVAPIIFSLALVFVFLFLAAQYESWVMPFMVMLSVPLALAGRAPRPAHPRPRQRHLLPDRPRHADRAREQERDPHRGVRPAAPRGGPHRSSSRRWRRRACGSAPSS